jgi:tRNA (guanine37-N1)-methyltransferase
MRFDVMTLFPNMFDAIQTEGVVARAIKQNLLSIHTWQLRDFIDNKYKNVDDKPYGGGAGMVMQVAPIRRCLVDIKKNQPKTKLIYLSPQGAPLTHQLAQTLAKEDALTLLCGRYEGVDERIIEHDVVQEVSIGDYVISGGELAAMVVIDAISRQIPGVLGNADSLQDSFAVGLLDYPHYTRPECIDGQCVPKVLLSGHQAKINTWRTQQALEKTKKKRPDLI